MMSCNRFVFIIAVLIELSAIITCNVPPKSDQEKANAVMRMAGINAGQLHQVIDHFKKRPEDSLKLKAAYFLIANMPGKGFTDYETINDKGEAVSFMQYCQQKNLSIVEGRKHFEDSTKTGIKFTNPHFVADLSNISAQFLIEDIEYAFKSWRLPYAKNLTFNEFKELILPYRMHDEPLQSWRKKLYDSLQPFLKALQTRTNNRFQAASIINDSLKKLYTYRNNTISFFPGHLTLGQMAFLKGGRCEDLNSLVGYWLRTAGIPVASEYTYYWSNSTGGHSWLSIMNDEHRFAVMNSLFDDPILDSLPFDGEKFAKAFRVRYLLPDSSLNYFLINKMVPNVNSVDVTADYVSVSDVDIKVNLSQHVGQIVYLGVLNGISWRPLLTKAVQFKDHVIFRSIAKNGIYAAVVISVENKVLTVSQPFLLSQTGHTYYYSPKETVKTDISIAVSNNRPKLSQGIYQLLYWDNAVQRWQTTESQSMLNISNPLMFRKIAPDTLTFRKVLAGGVYRIVSDSLIKNSIYTRPIILNPETKKYESY